MTFYLYDLSPHTCPPFITLSLSHSRKVATHKCQAGPSIMKKYVPHCWQIYSGVDGICVYDHHCKSCRGFVLHFFSAVENSRQTSTAIIHCVAISTNLRNICWFYRFLMERFSMSRKIFYSNASLFSFYLALLFCYLFGSQFLFIMTTWVKRNHKIIFIWT